MLSHKALFLSVFMMAAQLVLAQTRDSQSGYPSDPAKATKIFPNPATDYLSIKFEAPKAKTVTVTVHNIIGNLLELEGEIVDDFEIRLKVKDLPTGVYLLGVKDVDNSQSSFKFLKR